MSQYERWNTPKEIKRRLRNTADPNTRAGAVLYAENGNLFTEDSHLHCCVIGRTGKGKSQGCTLPFIQQIIRGRESGIIIDPKDECYMDIPEEYQVFRVDLRSPGTSPTKWDLLKYIRQMYRSPDPDDQDLGDEILDVLCQGIFPGTEKDPFWENASADFFKGLVYSLFDIAREDQINLESVARMMEQSESKFGNTTVLKSFYESLPDGSRAKRYLTSVAQGATETRGSILSVASQHINVFSRSQGLMELLSQDTLDILNLDVDRPFLLFIVLPDETNTYDSLAGLLVTQMTAHLLRIAQQRGGSLPIRVNLVLEELGSVGKAIPNLTNLITTGRSRNLRLMLVLQSLSQLTDLFGREAAETIHSCFGIVIAFATNDWETLTSLSNLCGKHLVERAGTQKEEPLISQTQLAAMETGQALVMIDGRYKFISKLPFYYQLYGSTGRPRSTATGPRQRVPIPTLNLTEYVKEQKKQKLLAMMWESGEREEEKQKQDDLPFQRGPMGMSQLLGGSRTGAAPEDNAARDLTVVRCGHSKLKAARVLAAATGRLLGEVQQQLRSVPCIFHCRSREAAENALREITDLGGSAFLNTDLS